MPPVGSKSRGGKARNDGRSRNTTPMSTTSNDISASSDPSTLSYDELLKEYGSLSSPPPVGQLKKIMEFLRGCSDAAKARSDNFDKGMRDYAKLRRDASETIRRKELEVRQAEEERKQKELKKAKLKKEQEDERPLAVGAHALAPQDGSAPSETTTETKPAIVDAIITDPPAQDRRESADSDTSQVSHQPRPEPAIPAYQTFGPDPSTFDDPTIYHIRDWTAIDDEDEKKEILGVTSYPPSDLHDLTCGTPPDRDLVNAKPQNQVTANQFATYLEPYVRPLTEEDLAFLNERGDRVGPFVIPRRGPRHYKDIWAEEDTGMFGDLLAEQAEQSAAIEANGNLEQMTDELAETSSISLGPMVSRLLAAMRPIHRPETNGDTQPNGTDGTDADGDVKMEDNTLTTTTSKEQTKPATYFAESSLPGFKTDFPKISAQEMDERVRAQLKHIGFLDEDAEPDYEGHHDDEVAARLRYLQEELTRISIINGARKRRIHELIDFSVAQQEWITISDDLDSQVNQAYLKRHRNMGKGKNKPKKPGQPGVATAISKPGIGDSVKAIMQRREQWRDMLGPVVEYGETKLPEDTIFDPAIMAKLAEEERVEWTNEEAAA